MTANNITIKTMKNIPIKSLALSVVALSIAACSTPARLNSQMDSVARDVSIVPSLVPQIPMMVGGNSADAARYAPTARRATKAWVGARMTDVQSDTVLPPIFSENFDLKFDDAATKDRVSIGVIAERLSRVSGVPVRVKPDAYQGARNAAPHAQPAQTFQAPQQAISTGAPLPNALMAGGQANYAQPVRQEPAYAQPETTVNSVEMAWNGTLAGFLDHVTGRLNLSWAYRDGVVVIERYMTETFEVATFGGEQSYKMGLTGGSSGTGTGGTASASLDVNESGKIAALESIRKSVESMVVPSGGTVVLNEASGRFTVSATRDVMSQVRNIIRAEDSALQRQAVIQFDVYSVLTSDENEKGVDWGLAFQNLSGSIGAAIKSPAALFGAASGNISVVSQSGRFASSKAVLAFLNQIGESATYRPVTMVALNRQWARKTNLKTDGYVSETTPSTASSAGSGAPGLKTSSITTGDKFLVQPAILDNGTIMLKFGVSLTELLGLFDVTAGSGTSLQKVQTPVTSGTDDQGTVRLNAGEAMVITGLSRRISKSDERRLAEGVSIGFGGSIKKSAAKEDFIIVVRATQM